MFEFAGFRLDLRARRLLRGDTPVAITVKAFDTLAALVEHAGAVVDKDRLMQRVWPDAVVEEANLNQQIFLLRKLLGEDPKAPRFIQTVPRRGYRFVAEVVERIDESAPIERRPSPALRLTLMIAPDPPLAIAASPAFAISPDGRTVAYVGREPRTTALYVRSLERGDSVRIARSEGAASPFFSPDSRWIGYFADGHLYKTLAADGAPLLLCDAGTECRGGCWTTRDEIVFAQSPASGLRVVPADGGSPRNATALDFAHGERTHRWPDSLPDGRHVLLTVARAGSASFDDAEIAIASLDTGERQTLVRHGSCGRYLPTGHLVYLRGGALMAIAFDAERLATRGSAIPVVDQVMTQPTGAGHFAFARTGLLLYLTGEAQDVRRRLVWLNGEQPEPLGLGDLAIEEPRLSPDGTRVAFGIRGRTSDVWIYDLRNGALARSTFEADNFAPVWMPDGTRLTFSSNRHGPCHIFSQGIDEREAIEVVGGDYDLVPGSWSPDGRILFFTEYNPATGANIWMCQPGDGRASRVLVRSPANDFGPACSPDGRSFAYTSDESGRCEVYVNPFPESGGRTQISVDGGTEPVWSRDGRLYYRSGSSVMAADIDPATRTRVGTSRRMAEGPYQPGAATGLPNYDVAADGRLLLIAQSAAQVLPDRLSVTVNWFADLVNRLA